MTSSVDPMTFKRGMSHLPTGVTVVATRDEQRRPYGLTVSSFASLSLDPPLIQWSIKETSHALPIFARTEMFSVNILSSKQEQVSRDFCKPIDRFATVEWESGYGGVPLIHGSLTWLECAKERILVGGDHRIIVGRVLRSRTFTRLPLIHWLGRYSTLSHVSAA